MSPFAPLADDRRVDVLDVTLAGVERVDLALIDVEADGAEAGVDEGVDQGEPDIAQPDHPDERRLLADRLFQRFTHESSRLRRALPVPQAAVRPPATSRDDSKPADGKSKVDKSPGDGTAPDRVEFPQWSAHRKIVGGTGGG